MVNQRSHTKAILSPFFVPVVYRRRSTFAAYAHACSFEFFRNVVYYLPSASKNRPHLRRSSAVESRTSRNSKGQPDSPELGVEFGSCCRSARAILIGILQNRQEMQFSAKDRAREGGYCAEVGRQGHPPNFVRPSIEEEQKFGGWICQRWVPRSAVAGRCGGANVLRKCKIARKCNPSVWIGRERVATVQKSEAGSSPKLCRIFYRRKTEVLGMDLSELGVMKRGLEGLARLRLAGIRQLKGSVCEVRLA